MSQANDKALFRTAHKDEAINQKVEFSVKNFALRIEIFAASLGADGRLAFAPQESALPPAAEAASGDAPPCESASEGLAPAANGDLLRALT